jgi:PAS domain S-box-containing protein
LNVTEFAAVIDEVVLVIRLGSIGTFTRQVAQAIASVVNIEVQVFDEELRLIAGTGIYGSKLNQVFDASTASSHVISNCQPLVIEQARRHSVCLKCVYRQNCVDLAEICFPIMLEDRCVGVIALIALSEEQRETLLSSKDNLFQYLEKMSRLLAYTLMATELNQRITQLTRTQETILDSIQEGLIALDSQGRIVAVNRSASVLLGEIREDLLQRKLGEIIQTAEEILHCIDDQQAVEMEFFTVPALKSRHFIGTITPLRDSYKEERAVICFRDIKTIPKMVQNYLRKEQRITMDDILGQSRTLREIKKRALQVARGDSSILITGESGTGKEMFARAIHYASSRASGPLISINCGAIPEGLLESELFGYEEGAFTGAKKGGKPGQIELANNGTLFLDEIGDLPLHLQVKLLRVLDEKQLVHLGGTKKISVNARIIAATNKDLEAMIVSREFREDLFYRLNVIPLEIAPLRSRPEDIDVYVRHFVDRYNRLLNKRVKPPAPEVMKLLKTYSWPGNVRELENVIEYLINIVGDDLPIPASALPERLLKKSSENNIANIKETEKQLIMEALQRCTTDGQSIDSVSKLLGISRATLYRKIRHYNLRQ